jgi:NAD(P)-dependent dehydrogenase (short-subunit alcohol dehydrogenase family)
MNRTQKLMLGVGLALAGREVWARTREADLTGRIVLITGGSRGLGLAMAREFAAHGCRLALCARDEKELARAKLQMTSQGADVFTVPCDLRDKEQASLLIQNVTEHYGRIDILVNNAGIIGVGPLDSMTVQDFEEAMQTDFWGTLYPTLAVLPQMRERKSGRIVNITSIGGKVSVPHLLPYSCAKFAATGFSEGLRAELARHGIVVTTIAPGLMRTGSFLNALFKGHQAGEYAWFSVGDNIPGLSLNAEGAARQIVQATRRGEAERMLGLPATLAAGFHGLFPGLTAEASALVNRVLPPPGGADSGQIKPGAQVQQENPSTVRDALTGLGFAAADRLKER